MTDTGHTLLWRRPGERRLAAFRQLAEFTNPTPNRRLELSPQPFVRQIAAGRAGLTAGSGVYRGVQSWMTIDSFAFGIYLLRHTTRPAGHLLWRWLALPMQAAHLVADQLGAPAREIPGRLIEHPRCDGLLFAERPVTRRLFAGMPDKIAALPVAAA